MTQEERLDYLITKLAQKPPRDRAEKHRLFRGLMNIRAPAPADEMFLRVQDAYLQQTIRERGIVEFHTLKPARGNLYLWWGDITTLRVDAIVNAANSRMLGCFVPCHGCIDNAIHTYAGLQLRLACQGLMQRQGREEEPGNAKITPGFNLPCTHVIHTVGPVVSGRLTQRDCDLLASCYRACLRLAQQQGIKSIAFCCISTGEYRFPAREAAEIALETVTRYLAEEPGDIKVVFNVFKESDEKIYRELLGADRQA